MSPPLAAVAPARAKPSKPHRRLIRGLLAAAASAFGAGIIGAVGWALADASLAAGTYGERAKPRLGWLVGSIGESFARLSYDLPFIFRGRVEQPGACIIYLDESSAAALGQNEGVWNRSLHAQLVRKLTEEGARAIFFDLVFSNAWPEPKVDEDFAVAIRENGHVFLGGALELDDGIGALQERTLAPVSILRRAAAGWGLLAFRPVDADYSVRRIYTGLDNVPSATWRAAIKLGAPLIDSPEERAKWRWMNYYGPNKSFLSLSYDRAIAPDGSPPNFFRDRIVFIGGRPTLGALAMGRDEFRTPFGWLNAEFSTGVEVHLTTLLNLLHGDSLTRLGAERELWLVLSFGVLLGGILPLFRPHLAAAAAVLAAIGIGAAAFWLFQKEHVWFGWCIPAFAQTPLAIGWAVGTRYFLEERRRTALRQAFSHYLSPQMADRIANADFDLRPGGALVEASVMFTDLEDFTALTERLNDPERLSEILTRYFTQTTSHVLENDGTIIKYFGDAVLAVWGAPIADKNHVQKAALAACRLHAASGIEVDGRALRTRVGLHSGMMLAGNLGSAQRFDYSVIGDAVNFASRLEGLNKYFGTNILISDATRQRLGDAFLTRCLGKFRVVGKSEAIVIHELLGPAETCGPAPWLEQFARGLDAFRLSEFGLCEQLMQQVIDSRQGADGPASFYVSKIAEFREDGVPLGWDGSIQFTSK